MTRDNTPNARLFKTKWAYGVAFAFFLLLTALGWQRYSHVDPMPYHHMSNTESLLRFVVPLIGVVSYFKRTQNALEKVLVALATITLMWLHFGSMDVHGVRWTSHSTYWLTSFALVSTATLGIAIRMLQIFLEPRPPGTYTPAQASSSSAV